MLNQIKEKRGAIPRRLEILMGTETPAKEEKCIGGLEASREGKERLEEHLPQPKQDSACEKELLP